MVNVAEKKVTRRTATASCMVDLSAEVLKYLSDGEIVTKKGAVFATAIVAGTMAVKRTHELIPLCHSLRIDGCKIDIAIDAQAKIHILCRVDSEGKTGVEMEALLGANIAALTVYDMCKSISSRLSISDTRLIEKKGGKSELA